MNRAEQHQSSGWRTLGFDACQLQSILRIHHKPSDESTAARLGVMFARHTRRQSIVRYNHWRRMQRQPINPNLTERLRDHVWLKMKIKTWENFARTVGRFQH